MYINFSDLHVQEDDIECESITVISLTLCLCTKSKYTQKIVHIKLTSEWLLY